MEKLELILCISSECTATHWRCLLANIQESRPPRLKLVVNASTGECRTISNVPQYIRNRQFDQTGFVVISDQFITEQDDMGLRMREEEYIGRLPRVPVANVALTERSGKQVDIDAVLPELCDKSIAIPVLQTVCQKLKYLFPPKGSKRASVAAEPPRELQLLEDLRASLRLRKSVYETMGYLGDSFIATKSSLELDWYDCRAVHFGIFATSSRRSSNLIGTARLILTKPQFQPSHELCGKLVAANPTLRRLLDKERDQFAGYPLPAFRSLMLNDRMQRAALSERPWGELSRVIVKPQWRGRGLSRSLIKLAIDYAISKNAEALLLECLDIHSPMYERHGFSFLGQRSPIYSVGRTMVAMERILECSVPLESKPISAKV